MINLFTAADKDRIEAAIFEAEARTSAEIVPCVTDVSASYEISYWRGAVFTAMIAVAAVLVLIRFYTGWGLAWLHTPWGTIMRPNGLLVVAATMVMTMVSGAPAGTTTLSISFTAE